MSQPSFSFQMTKQVKKQLIETELGIEKADRVIINGQLANVYTGEVLEGMAVSIKGEWLAYVGSNPNPTIGPNTDVIDINGQTMIPGLIDGHTHLDWLQNISEFLPFAMKGGTTTIVTETIELYPVAGLQGVNEFLNAFGDQPIKIFATAPPMMSISKQTRGISDEDLENLLSRPEIIGLGESYWQAVLQESDRILPMFDQVLAAGKILEGHSAGASEKKLSAYVACGISSCHEPINDKEVLERLRMGLYVMIREGSIRRDLENIAPILNKTKDFRRLILVTDGVQPKDLIEKGGMEYVVQKAIEYGFPPITAIQMATLNAAQHFGLDSYIGGLAPGRQADIVVVPNIKKIQPRIVISQGRIVAKEGQLLMQPRKPVYSSKSQNTVKLPRPMTARDFKIPAPANKEYTNVRIIDLVTELVTREEHISMPAKKNEIMPDPEAGVLKIAAIDRANTPGQCFTGLIRGFGIQSGAIASSAAWDTADIIVVGAVDLDMAKAVNRVVEMNGGYALSVNGRIQEEIPLPIFGLISQAPFSQLLNSIEKMTKAIRKLGFPYDAPLLTLITLTCQAVPFLRICEEGLVNLKNGETVGLCID